MLSSSQIRAARALLDWKGTDLTSICGIALTTLRRYESETGIPQGNIANLLKIKNALESQGIEFTGDPLKNPGVILHLDKQSSDDE